MSNQSWDMTKFAKAASNDTYTIVLADVPQHFR